MVGNQAFKKMNFNIYDIAAIIICAAISSMGLGGGGVLLLYLSLFKDMPPLSAQGLNLFYFIPASICSLIIYIKKGLIDFKAVLPMLAGSFAGVFIGKRFLSVIPPEIFRTIFAVFLTVTGALTAAGALKEKINK